ncbi:hypothetical protein GH714_041790 [Hevea brasiliensis]|uniref:DUF6857 domain-containing protein n=1 Tax=Hevea brasiliensis TaxID=3981 RepID=A0A6A6MX24_HEVBR|nr:hypothetical protein GH714_041790 [Hevea brasiliensis]
MEGISDTAVVKNEVNLDGSNPNASVSLVRSNWCSSSDDNPSSITKNTVASVTTKPSKIPSNSNVPMLGKEVLWQGEIILLAAVEALQEASAPEKLLNA